VRNHLIREGVTVTPYPARRIRTLLLLSLAGSALAPAEAFASMSFSATPTQLSRLASTLASEAHTPGTLQGNAVLIVDIP
jgi:hypothetical protein